MKKKTKILYGMTLVEMMMAIVIFLIGIQGFTLLFYHTWKKNSYTLEMGQSTMAVSQGLNKMVDYIRRTRQGDNGAYPVLYANDNELIIFCDYDKDDVTERLHFYKNNQDILMGITEPENTIPKTYPNGNQTVVTLVSNIVNDPSVPIFYYFDRDYPLNGSNSYLTTPAPVSDARLIKIYLEINIQPEKAPDNVKMESFVQMRNLSDYNQIQ